MALAEVLEFHSSLYVMHLDYNKIGFQGMFHRLYHFYAQYICDQNLLQVPERSAVLSQLTKAWWFSLWPITFWTMMLLVP